MKSDHDEALKRLLTPLTDEEAKNLRLVTSEEIEAAIRAVPVRYPAFRSTGIRYT